MQRCIQGPAGSLLIYLTFPFTCFNWRTVNNRGRSIVLLMAGNVKSAFSRKGGGGANDNRLRHTHTYTPHTHTCASSLACCHRSVFFPATVRDPEGGGGPAWPRPWHLTPSSAGFPNMSFQRCALIGGEGKAADMAPHQISSLFFCYSL